MANVCCSIEMEPRTLREGQLNHAREVAADVVQKLEAKEASTIFVKGLRPVNPVKEMEQIEELDKNQQEHELVDCKAKAAETTLESPCQCSIITTNIDSSDHLKLKEPFSAPF